MSHNAPQQLRDRARDIMRKRRANMSQEEKCAHLEKERARGRKRHTDPKKRASRTASKARTAQRKIANGICVTCSSLATCGRFCFEHWLFSVGRKYGLTFKNGGVEAIKSIWDEQVGMCALTGEKLVPGFNASIDHVLPRSRGGNNDKNNLQWVTKEANYFKRARTNSELVRMSLKVARHAERKIPNVFPLTKASRTAEKIIETTCTLQAGGNHAT